METVSTLKKRFYILEMLTIQSTERSNTGKEYSLYHCFSNSFCKGSGFFSPNMSCHY